MGKSKPEQWCNLNIMYMIGIEEPSKSSNICTNLFKPVTGHRNNAV